MGTYIGVVIFFALSGYLVTSGLLQKDFSVWKFIKKRMEKIYPSLIAVVMVSSVVVFFINGGLEWKYKMSAFASIAGLNNIYQIVSKMSYFDNFGMIMPLTHIWALSFQLQMYILFPFILKGLKKIKLQNKTIGIIFILVSVISAAWMGYKFYMGSDFSRIYYGTDTRAFAFFVAAGIACFYCDREIVKKGEKVLIYLLGISGIILIIMFSIFIDYRNKYNYYGLMFLVSILITYTIVLLTKQEIKKWNNPLVNRLLTPAVKLGQHQYQYYLWQYPIMIFSKEFFKWLDIDFNSKFLIQLCFLFIISELCYYLFEKNESSIIKIVNYIIFGFVSGFLIAAPIYVNEDLEEMKKIQSGMNPAETEKEKESSNADKTSQSGTSEQKADLENNQNQSSEKENPGQEKTPDELKKDERSILFIGDSVLDMTKFDLKKIYPNSIIETKIGRQFYELPDLLAYYAKTGKMRKIVVIALGTNGTIYKKDMEKVMKTLEGHEVYLISTVMPDSWQKSVNEEIMNASLQHSNVKVIDWYSFAKNKREYFYKDGTHPKPDAAKKYVDLIYSVVSKNIAENTKK
jgi:O-antigen acetylase